MREYECKINNSIEDAREKKSIFCESFSKLNLIPVGGTPPPVLFLKGSKFVALIILVQALVTTYIPRYQNISAVKVQALVFGVFKLFFFIPRLRIFICFVLFL